MYLLFDLDGTLTEPERGITNSLKYALGKYGIEETDMQKLRSCIGPPLIDAFENQWGFEREKAVEAVAFYREYFAEKGIFENELFDGIAEMLLELKAAGHTLLVATSKPEEYATRILEHFHILQYFDSVVGNTLQEERPKKEDVLHYIQFLYPDISRDNALMIGDRKYDVEGAKSLSLPCAAVSYGHGSQEELIAAGADVILPTVQALHQYLMSRGENE